MSSTTLIILILVIASALITLVYVAALFKKVNAIKVENQTVVEISKYIQEGAMAFLKREYKIMIPILIIVSLFLTAIGFIPGLEHAEGVGWQATICFLVGALFSGLAGFIGMQAAVRANSRTTHSAQVGGMPAALRVAFSGGSILGLVVVGLGLLGLTSLFLAFYAIFDITVAVHVVSGYGLGCSLIALFARVGGGIYTKAADVGADLVGKVKLVFQKMIQEILQLSQITLEITLVISLVWVVTYVSHMLDLSFQL